MREIFDDLAAEYDRIESILGALTDDQWWSDSSAVGWTVRDVVVHLAETEAGVAATLRRPSQNWTTRDHPLDEDMDRAVRLDRSSPAEVFTRWRKVRRDSVAALRCADPHVRVAWAAAPLRPATLATTRLAEHWAHMLDIVGPLGIAYNDTQRLRHVAWLGHSTLPYAFALVGETAPAIRCELTLPGNTVLALGSAGASLIRGPIGEFCRVGAQRLKPFDTSLHASDDNARRALEVLRNYAA